MDKLSMRNPKKASVSTWLSDDLLEYGVLPCLPTKALMRLKCVSKKWHRLISNPDPSFVHKQLQHAASCLVRSCYFSELEYLSRDRLNVGIPSINLFSENRKMEIVASNNGILCILHTYPDYKDFLVIGNPSLKYWKHTRLPASDYHFFALSSIFFGLAVDVTESSVSYNLVMIRPVSFNQHDQSYNHEINVFSSKSKQWTMCTDKIKLQSNGPDASVALCVKGTLYWKQAFGRSVLWFNIEAKIRGFLPLPMPQGAFATNGRLNTFYPCHGQLGEHGDKLSYAMIAGTELKMWIWDHSHWSKKIFISLYPVRRQFKAHRNSSLLVMPFEGGECLYFILGGVMYSYDILTHLIRREGTIEANGDSWFSYKNSMVSLK